MAFKYDHQTLSSSSQDQNKSPPEYSVSELSASSGALYPVDTMSTSSSLEKPVVVPQSTNIFFIKTFSPFARAYSPALMRLPNPISQDEFLSFIDGLNEAFLSPPVFQAMHIIGGTLLGSQILPAQAVGGVFQVTSVLGSAGFSIVRVRKFMKKANASMFKPRGLTVQLMTTKKMMAAIDFKNVDEVGKLKLPPLDDVKELDPFIHATEQAASNQTASPAPKEDPRIMRLKALEGHVAPLTFDVPMEAKNMSLMTKYGGGPLRWINKKQLTKLDKAREKSNKKREEKAPEVQREMERSQGELTNLERQITTVQEDIQRASSQHDLSSNKPALLPRYPVEGDMMDKLQDLEKLRLAEEEKRDHAIKEIYQKGDKKLMKVYKKEQKIANRILWVVIMKEGAQSINDEDLVRVDSSHSQQSPSME